MQVQVQNVAFSAEITAQRVAYIKRFSDGQTEPETETFGALQIFYFNVGGLPGLVVFKGRRGKSEILSKYLNEYQRSRAVDRLKEKEIQEAESAAEAAKRAAEISKIYQPGAILVSTWGYEQTNVDFYQVIERRGDFVTLIEISGEPCYDESFNDRGNVTVIQPALPEGQPFRRKITKYGSLRIESYKGASLWKGEPVSFSSYH